MPRYRPEIEALNPYEVGRPIEEVARELGLDPDSIIKLTANESPDGPFPGVVEAAGAALAMSNRYPDNDAWDLRQGLAVELGIDPSNLMFGNGSVALISEIVNAVGGPGTNIVYGWPSFVMYRFAAVWAGSEFVEVPLDANFELDLHAMLNAVTSETRCVVICNPNNPTGTIRASDDIEDFIGNVSEDVVVVVDEAYHDFVLDGRYRTEIPLAVAKPNVLVLRTFSKIYSLAAHRVGYAVGNETTLVQLRKAQAPLSVTTVSQAAALASLGQPDEISRRVQVNAAARHHLVGAIAERGLTHTESHTNFVFFKMPSEDSRAMAGEFTARGVILRPISGGWVRVTVGSNPENQKFLDALDDVLREISP
ncbi:MAG: histidinol-phosphate transaminase [Acidimicrobiia bacterium]